MTDAVILSDGLAGHILPGAGILTSPQSLPRTMEAEEAIEPQDCQEDEDETWMTTSDIYQMPLVLDLIGLPLLGTLSMMSHMATYSSGYLYPEVPSAEEGLGFQSSCEGLSEELAPASDTASHSQQLSVPIPDTHAQLCVQSPPMRMDAIHTSKASDWKCCGCLQFLATRRVDQAKMAIVQSPRWEAPLQNINEHVLPCSPLGAPLFYDSRATIQRHVQLEKWKPTMLLYDVSSDPPAPCPAWGPMKTRRKAYRVPLNGDRPTKIDNDHFVGSVVMLHRPQSNSAHAGPHAAYFQGKTRRWELRLQGRFRNKPRGALRVGIVMQDFDYSKPVTWLASWLSSLGFYPLESAIGGRVYFNWGNRGSDAQKEDAELVHLVAELCAFDQVIVTSGGNAPPALIGDLVSQGLCRNAMHPQDYGDAVRSIVANINTEDIYTFCIWGLSRFADVIGDKISDLVPMAPGIGMSSVAIGEWPPHFVMYSLDETPGACESDAQECHLECRKTYYIDFMVWSTTVPQNPALQSRYTFLDERK